jgi:hypothetical protein
MGIEEILPLLSPTASAFVTQVLQANDQQTLNMMLQIVMSAPDVQQGVALLEQAVAEFAAQAGIPTPDANPVAGAPPGVDPMAGAVPPMPPGMPSVGPEGMPPPEAMMPPGYAPAGAMPPLPPADAPAPPAPERPKQPPKKKVPKYIPPRVPKVPKPTYEQILEDARTGREFWRARDDRIREDYDLYHLVYDEETFGGQNDTVGAVIVHRRSQPNTLVNLVTTLTTAKNDKLTVEMEPRSDDDEHRTASQDAEDFILTCRELDEQWWLEHRVGEPPLPRKEAGLAALEGGFGWSWAVEADDLEYPFQYEVIPLSQLYDVGHACTRQFGMPLHKARARYGAIEKAYPLEGKGTSWDNNQWVRLIIHADNHGCWKSVVWEEISFGKHSPSAKPLLGSDSGQVGMAGHERWVEEPRRINYGFRYFNYVVWGGSPVEPMMEQEDSMTAYKGYGVLTMLRKTFRLMDLFISAVATGALTNLDPAYLHRVPDHVNKTKVKRLDRRPGAQNVIGQEDKVEPLRWDISASPDSINLMNSLIAELQDVSSPSLSGASGPSGIAQQISNDAASQQVVAPMIDALEKWYGLMHKQRLILAWRYGKDEQNKDEHGKSQVYFDSYQKRSYKGETSGQYGEVKPATVEQAGVRVLVRYHDRNTQEEMAVSQMCANLVNSHLMSQETALRKMGVKNPQQEIQRIVADGAFMEKSVLKALVETAVYNSGNQVLIDAWDKAFYAEAMQAQQGSPPAATGIPSMPNNPGVNAQGTSSAVSSPMQQQVGMMQ